MEARDRSSSRASQVNLASKGAKEVASSDTQPPLPRAIQIHVELKVVRGTRLRMNRCSSSPGHKGEREHRGLVVRFEDAVCRMLGRGRGLQDEDEDEDGVCSTRGGKNYGTLGRMRRGCSWNWKKR